MKLKRMVASVLALLLVASILPIGAMADDNEADNAQITTSVDTNTGKNVTVTETGRVLTNEGTITTVAEGGKVITNNGDIKTNEGHVGKSLGSGNPTGAGNFGTIETNSGTIAHNGKLVEHNQQGYHFAEDKTLTYDGNGIIMNTGTVTSNDFVAGDNKDGEVDLSNTTIGYIDRNLGSIGTNNGIVRINGSEQSPDTELGVIDENRGIIKENYDTVKTNGLQALDQNGKPVVIDGKAQYGTIEANYGTVVTNAIDGVVDNYNGAAAELSNDDEIEPPTEQPPVVAGVGTNFGTVHNKADGKTYYGLSWGESVDKLNSIESFVLEGDPRNLDEIANGIQRKGYKMKSYTAYSRKEGENVVIDDTADYEMNAPTWLEILWKKLGGKSEPKPTRTPVYTKLSGDHVKAGAFVSVNGCIFKIIEVNEDNIRVATVNQLPEKALTDMLGFLKQYLSDAQIAKFIGEPELLEQELVAKFFGGSNEHIAFRASRDLFA